MAIGKAITKFGSMFLYGLEFCCAALILGVFSYFMAVQADRDVTIPRWQQAVTGMAGVGVLYTLLAIVFVCCLGGKTFFAFIGVLMDLLLCGAFVAIAVLTRRGAHSCSGFVNTPLGNGDSSLKGGWEGQATYAVSLKTACLLTTACFAVAIAGAVLFFISAILQVLMAKSSKKEKRYGPGPNNNYTSGAGEKKFWQRKKAVRDPEIGATTTTTPTHHAAVSHNVRPSHDTAYTGTTVEAPHGAYENPNKPVVPVTGGYHTAPLVNNTFDPTPTHHTYNSTPAHHTYNNSNPTHTTPATNY
ncbi:hypothetical protein P153DRAFT_288061 [Dothidotthia symphoricarpi CBS 119687]|uniref:MARVEL domain-containing protein n=1 Tax=Dothidotthia symphoricarpi CBS 119687 TaxID=1392245 RepID=A0A6A6AKE4_9PLEO|nr:uncharacterized protein P153DRAFT_288061 [Dothidotthia symphoricarpi CBS 119687]KAF2130911.1 hypothetical protein P153DRAFT_288061 [Dothidotthia symphoricarpi CBS 119687]